MKKNNIILIAFILIIIVGLGYLMFGSSNSPRIGEVGSAHSHANFMVYLNGDPLDFAHAEYMVKVREVHIEDMNGVTIHNHATGVTVDYFFKTLGFEFGNECFTLDNGEDFCNNNEKKLRFFVNGIENFEYGNHPINNGEKYLITYGSSEEEIREQLKSLDLTIIQN